MEELRILNVSFYDAIRFAVSDIVTIAFMLSFLDKMYFRKFLHKYIYVLAYCAAVAAALIVSYIGSPPLNAVFTLLLVNAIAFTLYKLGSKMCIVYNLCFAIIGILADVMATTLLSALSGKTISETLGIQVSMYVSGITGWLILFLLYKILIALFKKNEITIVKLKEIILFVCITALEIAITAYFVSIIENSASGIIVAIFLFCFFLLDIYITYLIRETARISQLKHELSLANQQVNMQLKHYKEMLIKQEKAQSAIHDAKKHMLAVEGLFLNGNRKKAEVYTNLLCQKFDELTFDFKCSNQILGIIISTKLQEAENSLITLNPVIEDVSIDFISDLDITAIFANLLDNSLEECNKLPTELKRIKLLLKRKNNFLVINVVNPVRTNLTPNKRVFNTTKEGHDGIGLSNVLSAVEKYKGNFIAEVEDGNFIASITIPIPTK